MRITFGERGGSGGAEGDRTLDLGIANAALSQLSYGPTGRPLISRAPGARQLSAGQKLKDDEVVRVHRARPLGFLVRLDSVVAEPFEVGTDLGVVVENALEVIAG